MVITEIVMTIFLYCGKFEILKIQPVTHICTKGQKGKGNLGYNSCIFVFDVSVITANIYNCAKHSKLLYGRSAGLKTSSTGYFWLSV